MIYVNMIVGMLAALIPLYSIAALVSLVGHTRRGKKVYGRRKRAKQAVKSFNDRPTVALRRTDYPGTRGK